MQKEHKLTKQEFAQVMKEKRAKLFDMINAQLSITTQDSNKYLEFLFLLGKHGMNTSNTLLIQKQNPSATYLLDVARWRERGAYINKGAKGAAIFEPSQPYVKRDGSMGVNYNVKYVFDVTQTSISNTFNCSYPTSDELEFAFKHKEKDAETIYKNGNQQEYLIALLRHACRNSNPKDEFILESCVYSLASKYGLSMHTNIAQQIPSYFAYRNPKEIKEILKDIKGLFDIISKRINHGLYVYKEEHTNEQPTY